MVFRNRMSITRSRKKGAHRKTQKRQTGGGSPNRNIPAGTLWTDMRPQLVRIAGKVLSSNPIMLLTGQQMKPNRDVADVPTNATTTPADPMSVTLPYIKGMAKDAAGVLYIACGSCILAMRPSPKAEKLYSFDMSQENSSAIPIYPDMNLPGIPTTSSGDSMAPTISLYAGSPTITYWPESTSSGTAIRFRDVTGIAYSKQENCLYVTDGYSGVLLRVSIGVTPVTSAIVAGLAGDSGRGTNDGTLGSSRMIYPKGVAVDKTGKYVYIADYGIPNQYKGGLRQYTVATGSLSTIVKYDQSLFQTPTGVVVGSSNTIYVADAANRCIFAFVPDTSDPPKFTSSLYAGKIGWYTQAIFDGVALPANEGRFNRLTGLAIDSKDNIYAFDEDSLNSIRLITPSPNPREGANVYTYFGGTLGSASVDGDNNTAVLGGAGSIQPPELSFSGVYVDNNDLLYYGDQTFMGLKTIQYPYTNIVTHSYIDGLKASAARASSANAEKASSAIVQRISGSRASSAMAQGVSSAIAQGASSAVAQEVSSAIAQTVSSALAESISGARESSATAQIASSAVAQTVSSALAESISGARESSATAQTASSAVLQTALVEPVAAKDAIVADLQGIQAYLNSVIPILYSKTASRSEITDAKDAVRGTLAPLKEQLAHLKRASNTIFAIAPLYQDRVVQTVVSTPLLEALGYMRIYDTMRGYHIAIDSNGYIAPHIDDVSTRSALSPLYVTRLSV